MINLILSTLIYFIVSSTNVAKVFPYDGDSGTIKINTLTEVGDTTVDIRYRLIGVDCPETKNLYVTKSQFYSDSATIFIKQLLKGKEVTVVVYETDQFGRSLVQMWYMGQDVSAIIIKNGWGWYYKSPLLTKAEKKRYAGLQLSAKRWKKGLWAYDAVSPTDWKAQYSVFNNQ